MTRIQNEVLDILSIARDYDRYGVKLAEARKLLRTHEERVESGALAMDDLIVSKRLKRELRDYQKANLTAIAAPQAGIPPLSMNTFLL